MDVDPDYISGVRVKFAHITIVDVHSGDTKTMSKQTREEAARELFISIVRKYNATQTLSVEEMGDIYSYSDLIDCELFDRWEKEAVGGMAKGLELDEGRLVCRFAILADVYQLCCLFTGEFYRQMTRAGDLDPLVSFQGDGGWGTSILPDEVG
jgi:hypothetical protein